MVCMSNCVEVGHHLQRDLAGGRRSRPRCCSCSARTSCGTCWPTARRRTSSRRRSSCRRCEAAAAGVADAARHRAGRRRPPTGTLSFAELEAAPEGELVDRDPGELAALLYTGGTTGRSKGVMLSHNAMSTSAWAATTVGYDPEQNRRCCRCRSRTPTACWCRRLSLHAPEPEHRGADAVVRPGRLARPGGAARGAASAPWSRRCCRCCWPSRWRTTTCPHCAGSRAARRRCSHETRERGQPAAAVVRAGRGLRLHRDAPR